MQGQTNGRLGPQERSDSWAALDGGYVDVLVVGGGVTGAGVALDAATRGLSVALVEARDLASGTSSRSSKLFHGGLRYLEMLDFGLVREALHERDLLLTKLAPHLVTPVQFLYPLVHRFWERPYMGAGLLLYDALAGRSPMPRHRHLTRTTALARCPGLRPDALVGALTYFDASTDDARYTLMVARTAALHGAIIRPSTAVEALLKEDGRITGARLRDVDTGEVISVRAGVVIGCTGVWSDDLHQMAGVPSPFKVRASKGVHLMVRRDAIDSETGLILRAEKSVLFVIPWGEHWVVGTTDTPWDLELEHPAATRADIDYILGHVNRVLHRPLTDDDVVGVYAGLRPLLEPGEEGAKSTTTLSREHQVAHPLPGFVSVAGGKYTTYRVMAQDAVDEAVRDLAADVPAGVTDAVPLLGALGHAAARSRLSTIAGWSGVPVQILERMLGRYGDQIEEVLEPVRADPTLAYAVPGAPQHVMAEYVYGVTHEGALHLDDLLARRTRISVDTAHRGVESARPVAAAVAKVLGWSDDEMEREVDAYLKRVEQERASQTLASDAAAQLARSSAPDLRAPTG